MIAKFDGDYAFLSNFYSSPFTVDGITFPTVEHWFQAWKTKTEGEFKAIAKAKTPGQAKRIGRCCSLRPDWERIKISVMYDGLKYKFSDPELKQKLLDTGDEELVEGNTWHDNTWGNCSCPKCAEIEGKNILGKILMDVRQELREAESTYAKNASTYKKSGKNDFKLSYGGK